jgi:hypothetical protein
MTHIRAVLARLRLAEAGVMRRYPIERRITQCACLYRRRKDDHS